MCLEKLVIIPTFNERENIEKIVDTVIGLRLNYHILIIDDNSPDGTAEIIQSSKFKNWHGSVLFNISPILSFLNHCLVKASGV